MNRILYAGELMGRPVVAVVNIFEKQIGPVRSECLITGIKNKDDGCRLCSP